MSGHIKYIENGGKNKSFKTEDHTKLLEYNDIWNRIKGLLGIKFYSKTNCDEKYIKAKVKTFNSIVNTIFWGKEIRKEGIH